MKLKNVGDAQYIGMDGNVMVNLYPGDSSDVSDAFGSYLLSDDSPGAFELVKPDKVKKA